MSDFTVKEQIHNLLQANEKHLNIIFPYIPTRNLQKVKFLQRHQLAETEIIHWTHKLTLFHGFDVHSLITDYGFYYYNFRQGNKIDMYLPWAQMETCFFRDKNIVFVMGDGTEKVLDAFVLLIGTQNFEQVFAIENMINEIIELTERYPGFFPLSQQEKYLIDEIFSKASEDNLHIDLDKTLLDYATTELNLQPTRAREIIDFYLQQELGEYKTYLKELKKHLRQGDIKTPQARKNLLYWYFRLNLTPFYVKVLWYIANNQLANEAWDGW